MGAPERVGTCGVQHGSAALTAFAANEERITLKLWELLLKVHDSGEVVGGEAVEGLHHPDTPCDHEADASDKA